MSAIVAISVIIWPSTVRAIPFEILQGAEWKKFIEQTHIF